jgi:hypothetical protein
MFKVLRLTVLAYLFVSRSDGSSDKRRLPTRRRFRLETTSTTIKEPREKPNKRQRHLSEMLHSRGGKKPNKRQRHLSEMLHSRGGSIFVSQPKILVAKVATTVTFLQGTFSWFLPVRACEFYGVPLSALNEVVMKQVGNILIQSGIIGFWAFFRHGWNIDSLGLASIFRTFDATISLLSFRSTPNNLEENYRAMLVVTSLLAWNFYLSLLFLTKNRKSARLMERLNGLIQVVAGIVISFQPRKALAALSIVSDERILLKLTRGYGIWLFSLSILSNGLAWNLGAITHILAVNRLVVFARTLFVHFLGNTSGKFPSKQVPWAFYQFFVALLLLLPSTESYTLSAGKTIVSAPEHESKKEEQEGGENGLSSG